jgi:hypothetical protein
MELKNSKHGRMQLLAFDHVQNFLLLCLEFKVQPKAICFVLGLTWGIQAKEMFSASYFW